MNTRTMNSITRCFVLGSHLIISTVSHANAQEKPADTVLIVHFNTNISELDSVQAKSILSFISSVREIENVIGFADSIGSSEYNLNLSKRRALNTYKFIQTSG